MTEGLFSLFLEIDPDKHSYRSFVVDLSSPITRETAIALRNRTLHDEYTQNKFVGLKHDQNIYAVTRLLCEERELNEQREKTVMQALVSHDTANRIHQFETKITKLGVDSSLIVMRDISERCQRFEIEKKLIVEQTARKKDYEANRFTRHEVKNGLLAAIGLMDSIREQNDHFKLMTPEMISNTTQTTSVVELNGTSDEKNSESIPTQRIEANVEAETVEYSCTGSCSDLEECYEELDNTLRDILDAVMDHAMSLELVNGEYDVRPERVSVPELLSAIRRQS